MPKIALMIGKGEVFNKSYGTICYGIEDHAKEAVQLIRKTILAEGPMLISQSTRRISLTPQPLKLLTGDPIIRLRLRFKETKFPKGLFGFIRPTTELRLLAVIGAYIDDEGKFLDLIIGEAKKTVHLEEDEANEDGSDTENGGMS